MAENKDDEQAKLIVPNHQRVSYTSLYTKENLERILRDIQLEDFILDIGTLDMIHLPLIRDFSYQASDITKKNWKNIIVGEKKNQGP